MTFNSNIVPQKCIGHLLVSAWYSIIFSPNRVLALTPTFTDIIVFKGIYL